MRVLICGDRNWEDQRKIYKILKEMHQTSHVALVIEGGQVTWRNPIKNVGADYLAKKAAQNLGIPVMEFEANWDVYHKAAGPIRNGWMLKFGLPDLVLAFHSDIKNSKGTKNMVTQARKKGIQVKIIK